MAHAFLGVRRSAFTRPIHYVMGLMALVSSFYGVSEVLIIFLMGLFSTMWSSSKKLSIIPFDLFFYFIKIGSILFGSGYVLFAFLKEDLVDEKQWLTLSQLMDAIAVGQMTPGPVFTSATFIGYLVHGSPGALLATIGIFLPSFFFVFLTFPYISKMRSSTTWSLFLNGVNAASLALLVKVLIDLAQYSWNHYVTVLMSLFSLFLLIKFKTLNSAWLIIAASLFGYFFFSPS